MHRLAFFLIACCALVACGDGAPNGVRIAPEPAAEFGKPTPNSLYLTPENFTLPEGTGCWGVLARYKATLDNDLATGNVNEKVYDAVMRELVPAQNACAQHKNAEAEDMVAASRKRHGYPSM